MKSFEFNHTHLSAQSKVLLLLSGGKDSHAVLKLLKEQGVQVFALCIDGHQGQEKVGAMQVAEKYDVPLKIVNLAYFDEDTWNPFKLIFRDLSMGVVAIHEAKKQGCSYLATGVKVTDIAHPELSWLKPFLLFSMNALKLFGIQLIFPVWSRDVQQILNSEKAHFDYDKIS